MLEDSLFINLIAEACRHRMSKPASVGQTRRSISTGKRYEEGRLALSAGL